MATDKLSFLALIPARYGSSRFPGKPLAKIGGTEMIVRVCRRVAEAIPDLAVATDDERIRECVERNGFRAIMTSDRHRSGTDRIREALDISGSEADVVVNIQGDEPFIDPDNIRTLTGIFSRRPDTRIATLVRPFDPSAGIETLRDSNKVKVVLSESDEALLFSRSVIPFVRGYRPEEWPSLTRYYTHIGIYAYRTETLRQITELAPSPLETAESLEQLRWLQNGIPIRVAAVDSNTIGIDTPDDLRKAEEALRAAGQL